MDIDVQTRSKTNQEMINVLARFLAQELKLQSSRKTLTIRTQRGLAKTSGMRGVVGPNPNDSNHLIMIIDSAVRDDDLIELLCHEMVHVKQFALGQAQIRYTGRGHQVFWLGRRVKAKYWDQPWEQDAWRKERVLASRIYKILDKK
jgi:hypothetical protein